MIPLVISTYPENGSKDMVLGSPIVIGFASQLNKERAVDTDCIKLMNLNDDREIPVELSYDDATYELTITPSDDMYGNMFLGLTLYRLTLSNLVSASGKTMTGTYTLEFTTVSDSVVDVIPPPAKNTDSFDIINLFPKRDSFDISTGEIKVKFNMDVDPLSVSQDTFIVTTSDVEDVDDIGFISIDIISGDYDVSSQIVSFKPYIRVEGQIGIGAGSGANLLKTFRLPQSPVYRAIVYIDGMPADEDVDYTINMATGMITFADGHEPAAGSIVSADSYKRITLSDNVKYTIIINGIKSMDGDVVPQTMYSFHSKFSPVYAHVRDILTDSIAAVAKELSHFKILEYIRDNSNMAEFIATNAGNYGNIDWKTPEKIVVEYVKAKTKYDIIMDSVIKISNDSTMKQLGDFLVQNTRTVNDLLRLADRLKHLYEYWENMLKGNKTGKVTPKPFRKGENVDESPEFMNRQFKDWTGTRSW